MRTRSPVVLVVLLALLAACSGRSRQSAGHAVTIVVRDPGAAAEQIETTIVIPLEAAVADIPGVVSLSARAETGLGQVVVTSDRADLADAVRARIEAIRPNLPPSADLPEVRRAAMDAPPAAAYRITGDRPPADLSDLARHVLARRLEQLAGIAEVSVRGAQETRLEVRVSPAMLAGRGVALTDIADAIARANVSVPAGSARGADALGALVVEAATAPVPLRDIAQISETTPRISDEPLHIRVTLQEGADREKTLADLETELARLRAELPPGVTLAPYVAAQPAPARFALCGPDRARLAELSRSAHRHASSLLVPEPPPIALAIDRDRAARQGIEVGAIARTVALATGQPIGAYAGSKDRPIVIALDGTAADIAGLVVRSRTGVTPLSAVTTETAQSDAPRDRVDRMPAVLLDDPAGLPSELPAGYSLRPQ